MDFLVIIIGISLIILIDEKSKLKDENEKLKKQLGIENDEDDLCQKN